MNTFKKVLQSSITFLIAGLLFGYVVGYLAFSHLQHTLLASNNSSYDISQFTTLESTSPTTATQAIDDDSGCGCPMCCAI